MEYIIKTSRLGLRAWQSSDLDHYILMNQDEDVMKHFPRHFSPEESIATTKRFNKHLDNHGFTFFAAELLDTNQFIGFIGMIFTNFEAEFTPCVEIGWRLSKEFWGKGYATEGANACLEFAFNELHIDAVVSFTILANLPSEKVMQRIGMTKIDTFAHPKIETDHPMSKHLLYKISKDEFQKSQTKY